MNSRRTTLVVLFVALIITVHLAVFEEVNAYSIIEIQEPSQLDFLREKDEALFNTAKIKKESTECFCCKYEYEKKKDVSDTFLVIGLALIGLMAWYMWLMTRKE